MTRSSQQWVAGIVLAVSALVTVLSIWAVATQWNISSDLRALLSRDSPAAKAMKEMRQRVGSSSSLFAIVDSPDTDANIEFAERYARELRKLPEVTLAHFHNDKTFFKNHLLLYFDASTLEEIQREFVDRLERARRRANPLFVPLDEEEAAGRGSSETSLPTKLERKAERFDHAQFKEYLLSSDRYALTIVVRFKSGATSLVETGDLIEKVKRVGQELEPETYHADMKLQYGGGLINRKSQYRSIVQDIRVSAIFTVVGIFLLIALYFRRLRAIAFVLVPLVAGALWALAIAFSLFGQLTTISVFIFAILLGLGIDYAIHLLSSFDERISEGRRPFEALRAAFRHTGRATLIGAGTTLTTFFLLAFADSRGLSEFGVVAGIGVLCTLVAMFVVLPAMIVVWDRSDRTGGPDFFLSSGTGGDDERTQRWFERRALPVGVVCAVFFTGGAVVALPHMEFEQAFQEIGELRPIWESEQGGHQNRPPKRLRQARRAARQAARNAEERAIDVRRAVAPDSFRREREQKTVGDKYTSATNAQISSTPTVLLFDSKRSAEKVYHYLAQGVDSGKYETIQAVNAIYGFLPGTEAEQKRRLEAIAKLRSTYESRDLSLLGDRVETFAERFRRSIDVRETVDIYDLPGWTKRLFRENGPKAKPSADGEDFAFEYVVYVTSNVVLNHGKHARAFLEELRGAERATDTEFRIASPASVVAATLEQLQREGFRLFMLALVVIVFALMFAFRSPSRGLVASLPLGIGLVWMTGIIYIVGMRFDMFNVVIIPAIIGIGVDDGVHFYSRYLENGRGSVWQTFQTVGSTIVVTSITSMVGFGGLTLASYRGVRSIGHLAIAGISATLLATLIVLPAILVFAEKVGWNSVLPEE